MQKETLLAAMFAVFAVVVCPAWASFDPVDRATPWDYEWDCDTPGAAPGQGDAVAAAAAGGWLWESPGWGRIGWNSKFTPGTQVIHGWITAQGNPGSEIYIYRPGTNIITKASGWTVEWRMEGHKFGETDSNVALMRDEVNYFGFDYARTAASLTVTMKDLHEGGGSSSVVLTSGGGANPGYNYHIYRLVRCAGSNTVELYVDNNFSSPAAQLTPIDYNPGDLGASYLSFANSKYEAAWDFFGVHRKAVAFVPEPATLLVVGVGGILTLLARRRR